MMPRKPMSPQVALDRCRDLCSRAEMSPHEILKKLARWGVAPSSSAKIIELLKRDRYLDEERFARAFVLDKMRFNLWGRIKIKMALSQHCLDSDMVAAALDKIDPREYLGQLRQVIAARSRLMPRPLSYDDKMKVARYAAGRGFESDLIFKVLRNEDTE